MSEDRGAESLEGRLLVAMPGMLDSRFERAVIYICAHSAEGAMGLIVNKVASELSFGELISQLGIKWDGVLNGPRIHIGGPVENGRGFVLHSLDYSLDEATMVVDDEIGMTATLDILKDIAAARGPEDSILALGYSGWGPGQIEGEIRDNGWLICPAESEIIFRLPDESKWGAAMRSIGIDPRLLSAEGGSA